MENHSLEGLAVNGCDLSLCCKQLNHPFKQGLEKS